MVKIWWKLKWDRGRYAIWRMQNFLHFFAHFRAKYTHVYSNLLNALYLPDYTLFGICEAFKYTAGYHIYRFLGRLVCSLLGQGHFPDEPKHSSNTAFNTL